VSAVAAIVIAAVLIQAVPIGAIVVQRRRTRPEYEAVAEQHRFARVILR
jgi:hypothetical protein